MVGEYVVDRLSLMKKRCEDVTYLSSFHHRSMRMLPGTVQPDLGGIVCHVCAVIGMIPFAFGLFLAVHAYVGRLRKLRAP